MMTSQRRAWEGNLLCGISGLACRDIACLHLAYEQVVHFIETGA